MLVSDFDYELPEDLIAQEPVPERTASRLLVVERQTGVCTPRWFREFPQLAQPGDCLVLNDTRVIPARLHGIKAGGGARLEALLLEPGDEAGTWRALLRPGKRVRVGTKVLVAGVPEASFTVLATGPEGVFTIGFHGPPVAEVLERGGAVPLPPYIRRPATARDGSRYQTVYARCAGAVAAPTAGLHFDEAMLAGLAAAGVRVGYVTLHVGLGTFKPVTAERVEDHVMHEERFVLSPETAAAINGTRSAGGRVIAVGTTTVRVLEACADAAGQVTPQTGATRLFLYPPYQPRVVDALLTNFHLPRSTLLMLVSCFVGRERLLAAYACAVRERFRFYSYGDCMFLA